MAETIPQFDSLAQGLDYANVPTPSTDAADTQGASSSQHVMDSTNDSMSVAPTSVASRSENLTLHGVEIPSNYHDDPYNYLNPEKPIF